MTWGNLVALRQTNLKRMLAYSSISHAGFVTAGIVAGANLEVLYYLYIYAVMNLVAFSIVAYLENASREVTLDSISGLMTKKPWSSVGLSIVFLSLAGFPPLAGFWAKLFLLQKVAESELFVNQILLVLAVINSAIAFFYYVKIVIYSFMNSEEGEIAKSPEFEGSLGLLIASGFGVVMIGLVWLFFHPSSFL
jgi:NADH-quinone oxidoreductase subunit N